MDNKKDREKRSSFLEKINTFRLKDKKDKSKYGTYKPPTVGELGENGAADSLYVQQTINSLTDKEVNAKFEQMLDDMNLSEEKKAPLRDKKPDEKRKLLAMQWKGSVQQKGGKVDSPQDFINALNDPGLRGDKRLRLLESLRVSLTSNPVSWVQDFGQAGLNAILKNMMYCFDNRGERRSTHECVRCLKAFMNNKFGLMAILSHDEALTILSRSVDTADQGTMLEAVRLLAAICLVPPDGHDKVLDAITMCGEFRNQDRFTPVVEGIAMENNPAMRVACIQLFNAIVTTPDDIDFRMHLRNEFMRTGMVDLMESLERDDNEEVKIHVGIFFDHKDEDFDEFCHRYENVRTELDDPTECYQLLMEVVRGTTAETYFLSILQHLLFIRDDMVVRSQYYKLIEECVSQIVLHRSGVDPDFRYTRRFEIDVEPLIGGTLPRTMVVNGQLIERSKVEELSAADVSQKLESALTAKQESEAKVLSLEEKTKAYEVEIAELKEKISQGVGAVVSGAISKQIAGGGGPPPPPPPPLPPGAGPPPPPPLPGMGGPPPPPPPPPPPGMGGPPPPPPPPPPGGGPPPPPPPMGALRPPNAPNPLTPPTDVLPYGMKPKKTYQVDTPLKRANWNKIRPQNLDKESFWVRVQETELESDDILTGLKSQFSSKPIAKKDVGDAPAKELKTKKVKELKVLDAKASQNLAILLGSIKIPYPEILRRVLEVDEENLTVAMVEQLIKYLPEPEQINKLAKLKDEYNEMAESEQFCVVMSGIKRLQPRLNSMVFKMKFDELVSDVKPDIVAATEACEEVKNSQKFGKILELILLMGNYMNSGSRNAKSVGFEMNYLTKLSNTKSQDNKTTLLHFLAQTVESKFPDLLNFSEELIHVYKAARVSEEVLTKNMALMKKGLSQMEIDIKNFSNLKLEGDRFPEVMGDFLNSATEQHEVLSSMHKKMDGLFKEIAKYFAFDPKKYTLDEFFGDVKTFLESFNHAVQDNIKLRETEEKIRRAKEAKEKAAREKQEKMARKKQLIDMNADDDQEGVMDNLLEALKTGTAFNVNREKRDGRKRTPRAAGAERRAQLARSRSRQNISMTADLVRDINFDDGTDSPKVRPERRKKRAVEKQSRSREGSISDAVIRSSSGGKVDQIENNGDDAEALLARLKAL